MLAYLCVDFGFWHKLFQLRPEDNAHLSRGDRGRDGGELRHLPATRSCASGCGTASSACCSGCGSIGQLALVAVAVIDPRLAATFARLSFLAIGGVGGDSDRCSWRLRGQDRALSLVPTWMLLLVWLFGAGLLLTGRLSGDVAVSGLVAGLVLIVVLIGFTVTQFAFRALDPLYGRAPGRAADCDRCAIESAGAAMWEWNARRDEIKVVADRSRRCSGSMPGELSLQGRRLPASTCIRGDRERFKLLLWSITGEGRRRACGSISACAMPTTPTAGSSSKRPASPSADRRSLRCVGLVRDITDAEARAGAAAARRRARQSDRPAEPRAVPRPAGDRGASAPLPRRRCIRR